MPFVYNPISNQFDIANTGGGGGSFKDPVGVATTQDLDAIYDNGVAGVGATLTNNGVLAALVIDGITTPIGSRVLIKDQDDQIENGVYVVTDAGSVSDPWILTRATDYDEPSEIAPGDLFPIATGLINSGTIWEQAETVDTIGTDPFLFIEFNNKEVSLSPYIVGANKSDFLFIQDAIDEAVAQGYTSSNPCNIYLKPKAGGYAENILMSDGVNLIGIASGNDLTPVLLTGEITWPNACNAIIARVKIEPASGNALFVSGGKVYLSEVDFSLTAPDTAIYLETTNTKNFNLYKVTSNASLGILFDSDNSAQTVNIEINDSTILANGISDFYWTGSLSLNVNNSTMRSPFILDVSTVSIDFLSCNIQTQTEIAFDCGVNTEGSINLHQCKFSGQSLFVIQNPDLVVSTPYCVVDEQTASSYASNQDFGTSKKISSLDLAEVYEQERTGWRGCNTKYSQSFLQTTDDTPTVLSSIPISELESVTMQGLIVASTADHSASLNGNFCF